VHARRRYRDGQNDSSRLHQRNLGLTELAETTRIPCKSVMRIHGPTGNPRSDNLFEVVDALQRREGVRFHVKAVR